MELVTVNAFTVASTDGWKVLTSAPVFTLYAANRYRFCPLAVVNEPPT